MPRIIVTPLSLIEETILADQPSHLLTLLGPDYMIAPHGSFAEGRHLRVQVHDIAVPLPGQVHPGAQHAKRVLVFAEGWDRKRPMLIHCWAGISRSTASMFMILCKFNPQADEAMILRRMRASAPHIQPNRLLVAHADAILGRDGRMVEALDSIGPARPAEIGYHFELAVDLADDGD